MHLFVFICFLLVREHKPNQDLQHCDVAQSNVGFIAEVVMLNFQHLIKKTKEYNSNTKTPKEIHWIELHLLIFKCFKFVIFVSLILSLILLTFLKFNCKKCQLESFF